MKDELTRLKKIVDKDPKSTMFVPLAEEYRKQGRLEEATEILKKGLMVQPLYTTGRVALGKVLMEREMLQEAREEFERILDAMPENIAARKKLAEIYSSMGRTDLAQEHEQVVSGLTPPPTPRKGADREEGGEIELPGPAADTVVSSPFGAAYAEGFPQDDDLDLAALELDVESPAFDIPAGTPSDEASVSAPQEGPAGDMELETAPPDSDIEGESVDSVIEIATESMADVYISQNLYDKAMEVLLKLEKNSPDNRGVQQKIQDLRMLMTISKQGGAPRG